MTADVVLPAITITSLAATLAIFSVLLARRGRRAVGESVDFGAVFSAFVAGWMATELLEVLAPSSWTEANEVVHFAVLALFAAWMNVRWRWALRRAREVP